MHRRFRFGVVAAHAPSGDEWRALARRAERLGYATLLMPDRLAGQLLSPMPALVAAAVATNSIRLGTFVLAVGWRNPVLLARECATLDLLSGGRFELGLGAGVGGDDARRAGFPSDRPGVRVDRLAEMLGILDALLSGQEANASGVHYQVAGARSYPPPAQKPRPPILVAAGGKRSLALAAREADIVALGVRPNQDEAVLAEKIGWLHREAGERQLELNMNLVAVVGEGHPETRTRERLRSLFGLDLAELVRVESPFVVSGTTDEMCEQLLGLRRRLGISYITVPADLMDTFAPVVERLAGS